MHMYYWGVIYNKKLTILPIKLYYLCNDFFYVTVFYEFMGGTRILSICKFTSNYLSTKDTPKKTLIVMSPISYWLYFHMYGPIIFLSLNSFRSNVHYNIHQIWRHYLLELLFHFFQSKMYTCINNNILIIM